VSGTLNTSKSREDAFEEAMRDHQPGDVIVIHESECGITTAGDEADEETCTCTPMTLTVGAEA